MLATVLAGESWTGAQIALLAISGWVLLSVALAFVLAMLFRGGKPQPYTVDVERLKRETARDHSETSA